MPDPDSTPDTSARHTIAPPAISPRVETPPGVEAAATPRSSPPIALTVAQVTTTSDAPTTVVIDNITLRPTA